MAKKKLREFKEPSPMTADTVIGSLQLSLGRCYRVGGPSRVYIIDDCGLKAAIYSFGKGTEAIALAWKTSNKIETVYYWGHLDLDAAPDYAIDLPDGDFRNMAHTVSEMIKRQQLGQVDL